MAGLALPGCDDAVRLLNVQLIELEPSLGSESASLMCNIVDIDRDDLPEFTILFAPPEQTVTPATEITIDGRRQLVVSHLALALRRLRYATRIRYLCYEMVLTNASQYDERNPDFDSMHSQAQYLALWRVPRGTIVKETGYMDFFNVVFSEHVSDPILPGGESREIRLMELLPLRRPNDPIEVKIISTTLDDMPDYTRLSYPDEDEIDDTDYIIVDGVRSKAPNMTEAALSLLLPADAPRFILAYFIQKDHRQKSLMHFEVRKSPICSAFWYDDPNTTWPVVPDPNSSPMDRFVILPNRYSETFKYYTALDYNSGSRIIRVIVLPPSDNLAPNLLKCTFRNISLNDLEHLPYQLFMVAGPESPRNGRKPTYKYDVEINGYLSVVSDGLRNGLQWMQDSLEERLIWNQEVCVNCYDEKEAKYFADLSDDILSNASAGGVLLYDRLSSFTVSMNKEYTVPLLNRQSREIRLLEFINPQGSDRKKIICKLVVKDLDDAPQFKALSYNWGRDSAMVMHFTNFTVSDNVKDWPIVTNSTTKTAHLGDSRTLLETICINGASFVITKHLADALQCLRDRGDAELFWVDAICIDQRDPIDRSSQVRMMGNIYSGAQQVIAWLGRGSEETQFALSRLNDIGSDTFNPEEFKAWVGHVYSNSSKNVNAILQESSEYKFYSRILQGLQNANFADTIEQLVFHEWWQRLWVYQEAVLPVDLRIHCGNSSIKYEALWDAVEHIRMLKSQLPGIDLSRHSRPGSGKYAKLAQIRMERRRRHDNWSVTRHELLFYLDALGRRWATDPRDVIYAALGLTQSAPKSIVPDYSKSIVHVWTDAAKAVIKQSNNLLIISLCTGALESAEEWALAYLASDSETRLKEVPLPSWVPQWGEHRIGMGAVNLKSSLSTVPEFCSSAGSTADARFSKDGRILFARGFCIDVITKVLPGYSWRHSEWPVDNPELRIDGVSSFIRNMNRTSWLGTFTEWETAVMSAVPDGPSYVAEGDKVDALMHLLNTPFYCNCVTGLKDDVNTSHTFSDFMNRRTQNNVDKPSALAKTMYEREIAHDGCSLTISSGEYRMVVTEKGYVGVSGGVPKEGDSVCILKGAGVPFILRQVGHHDRYLLVSDSYIHGLMYGAGMQGLHPETDLRKFPII